MSDLNKDLREILGAAYQARVLGMGKIDAVVATFKAAAADPDFLAFAQSERLRLRKVAKQCFVSRAAADFLDLALA